MKVAAEFYAFLFLFSVRLQCASPITEELKKRINGPYRWKKKCNNNIIIIITFIWQTLSEQETITIHKIYRSH